MTKEQLLAATKLACRISSTALDDEISSLIDAAYYDLEISGVANKDGVIYEKDGKSHSAIFLMSSLDGLDFKFEKMLIEPQEVDGKDWMKQFVYASHLVRHENTLRLYFNARNIANPIMGRECIGFAEATI